MHHSEPVYNICFQFVAGNELTQSPMLVERLASEPTVFQSLIQLKLLPHEQTGTVLFFWKRVVFNAFLKSHFLLIDCPDGLNHIYCVQFVSLIFCFGPSTVCGINVIN